MKICEKLSIVWDLTKRCPWECSICCMGGINDQKCWESEPTFEQKMFFLENAGSYVRNGGRPCRFDFSGGELFTDFDNNVQIIERAAELFGKENVGISTSGWGMSCERAERLAQSISDCEMTMDTLPETHYTLRPCGYAFAAQNAVPLLKAAGIKVGIQTVLTVDNTNADNLTKLHARLCDLGVDEWSFIPFFPSGRGLSFQNQKLSEEAIKWVVEFIKDLDAKTFLLRKPKIDFHYSMPGHCKYYYGECRCVKKSIGILADGSVLSCFWAVDKDGKPNRRYPWDKFILGNITENTLGEILESPNAQFWLSRPHTCEFFHADFDADQKLPHKINLQSLKDAS